MLCRLKLAVDKSSECDWSGGASNMVGDAANAVYNSAPDLGVGNAANAVYNSAPDLKKI